MPTISSSSKYGVRAGSALLLRAGAELRRHLRADDHHQAGPAAAGRVPPAADQRRLRHPRRRHLPARPRLFRAYRRHADARRPELGAAASKATASLRSTSTGCGAGTRWLLSDKTFLQDYNPHLSRYRIDRRLPDRLQRRRLAGLSRRQGQPQLFRRALDLFPWASRKPTTQSQIPVIHPVVDYTYTFDHPVFGGELGYKHQFHQPDARTTPISMRSARRRCLNGRLHADRQPRDHQQDQLPAARLPRHLYRFSAEAHWRRSVTDSIGQVWTPFASVRGDVATHGRQGPEPAYRIISQTGSSDLARAMPTVGLEYRYPFINVQSWGTQTSSRSRR